MPVSYLLLFLKIPEHVQNVIGLSFARGLAGIGFAVATPCGSGLLGTHLPEGRGRTLAFAALAGGTPISSCCMVVILTSLSWSDWSWFWMGSRRSICRNQSVSIISHGVSLTLLALHGGFYRS